MELMPKRRVIFEKISKLYKIISYEPLLKKIIIITDKYVVMSYENSDGKKCFLVWTLFPHSFFDTNRFSTFVDFVNFHDEKELDFFTVHFIADYNFLSSGIRKLKDDYNLWYAIDQLIELGKEANCCLEQIHHEYNNVESIFNSYVEYFSKTSKHIEMFSEPITTNEFREEFS